MDTVTSIELARKLMKIWKLPPTITSLQVSLGVGVVPTVTVSYLVTKEEATELLEVLGHYDLVERDEQT